MDELSAGWRLGCEAVSHGAVTLDIEQWSPVILSDSTAIAFEPRDTLAMLVKRADERLYDAKAAGRNRVVAETRRGPWAANAGAAPDD